MTSGCGWSPTGSVVGEVGPGRPGPAESSWIAAAECPGDCAVTRVSAGGSLCGWGTAASRSISAISAASAAGSWLAVRWSPSGRRQAWPSASTSRVARAVAAAPTMTTATPRWGGALAISRSRSSTAPARAATTVSSRPVVPPRRSWKVVDSRCRSSRASWSPPMDCRSSSALVLVAGLGPVEVREAVEVDADGVDVAVGEVVAGGQLDEHRAGEVLGCRGVAGDGEGAEGFEVDEHGLAVTLADGDEAREHSWLRRGGNGEVGVVQDAPGPSAVGGFPWGGCRRHR